MCGERGEGGGWGGDGIFLSSTTVARKNNIFNFNTSTQTVVQYLFKIKQ